MPEENLQIAEKTREAKGKEEKERYTHLKAEFQGIARRDKKISSIKLEIPKKHLIQEWAQ